MIRKPFDLILEPSFGFGEIYGRIFGLGGKQHAGIDYPLPDGIPIKAGAEGYVLTVRHNSTGYGNHIEIDYGNSIVLYAHLSSIFVVPGEAVSDGQVIGASGHSGYATGPHIHIGVRLENDTQGEVAGWCNPSKYIDFNPRTPTPPPPNIVTYTVERGDSLWAISLKVYGNGGRWTDIFNANRDKITNPNIIHPGQVLTIP